MTHTLTIEPTGDTVAVAPGQTILDACLRAGLWLPHACGHGLCGTCKVDIVDGAVDHGDASGFALMDFERQDGKALACTATLTTDTTIEADLDEDSDAQHIPIRDLDCTVTGLSDLTHDVKQVVLTPIDGSLPFQAGQYVTLALAGITPPRAFSLANPPGPGPLVLQVRRVPGGVATTHIHDHLTVGERVRVTGPYGRFFVRKSATLPMIFLAGGTGLSSPKAMILDLLAEGRDEAMTLIHGVRTRADLYDDVFFRDLCARHPNLTYLPALSEPGEDHGWTGETGFVHQVLARRFPQGFAGQKAYLCGPPAMIEACLATLMRGRLFESDIYAEQFLTQANAQGATKRSPVFRRL